MPRLVKVEVLKTLASGIQVKILENGRPGFIRQRELSWDRGARYVSRTFAVGQILNAVILQDDPNALTVELSLRQVSDPWKQARGKYWRGQIVEGEIVNIRNFGVFIQLEPGIDAIIWRREIPLLKDRYQQK
jgi:small subunit ribosomal protein S1